MSRAENFFVVLNEYAVMKDRQARGLEQIAGIVKARTAERGVERLPLPGRARGVKERRVLAIDRSGLSVGVSIGPVGIEDLQLVKAHEEDAAIAAVLALAGGGEGDAHSRCN